MRAGRHQSGLGMVRHTACSRAPVYFGAYAFGRILAPGWLASTTTDRARTQLLRSVIEEVIVNVELHGLRAMLTIRWRGGATTAARSTSDRSTPSLRSCFGLRSSEPVSQ